MAADDFARGFAVQSPVEGDDAAKGRGGIAAVRGVVGSKYVFTQCRTAGVGVFDDDAGGLFLETDNGLQGGVGVSEVVVGERFTL